MSAELKQIRVVADLEVLSSVGVPFDLQLDDFWVAEWGIEGVKYEDIPSWVQFVNKTIDLGIKFKF